MVIKLLALSAVMYVIYVIFFKNKSRNNTDNENEQIDTMIECNKCQTFVSKDEAIISNGQCYCSSECTQ